MKLEDISIHAWIQEYGIKTEKGSPIKFDDHLFLFDFYRDENPHIVCLKAAQIGFSVSAIMKVLYIAKKKGIDIIYTMPADADVSVFVSGKVNRIIANNDILQSYTKDKDTIEQKNVGKGMVYFRGTFSKRAAISVTADLLVHDELDFSDQEVIGDYDSRLQHSELKWKWWFGHPSAVGVGVDRHWVKSDQKHWFVTCPSCNEEHYMNWPDSFDMENKQYICKLCKEILPDEARRTGRWVAKYKDRLISGYWIPLFIAPWISAEYIIDKFNDQDVTDEFFWNRVLGLPYAGSGNTVSEKVILSNYTDDINSQQGRIVIGCDTGKHLRFVIGNEEGIFFYDQEADVKNVDGDIIKSKYDRIEGYLRRWSKAVVVFDQGGEAGDSVAVRKLKEKYLGRVFLAFYREDTKSQQLIRWGKGDDDESTVLVDRNRMIQRVIDEFADHRLPLFGENREDWWEYWLHWKNIYRVVETMPSGQIKRKWMRNGRDDWVHATVYFRVGMDRFNNGQGLVINPSDNVETKESFEVTEDGKAPLPHPNKLILPDKNDDWRE